jgi:hypothetical protein
VWITDDNAMGFYDTVATVTGQQGELLGLSRFLNHDYGASVGGRITSVFPVVSGYHIERAGLEELRIDGNKANNEHLHGCRGGGVFLYQAHGSSLRGLTVRGYNGDGISFQQCRRLQVEDCRICENAGGGIHPGSGSVGAVMRNLEIRDNGGDGVFYCLRVSWSLCEKCVVRDNSGVGISLGGRDTDHLIQANTITGNGKCGVHFRPGVAYMGANRNVLRANTIGPNRRREGQSEIVIEDFTQDVELLGNQIDASDQQGVFIAAGCENICIIPKDVPPQLCVGPEHMPADAGRHLSA